MMIQAAYAGLHPLDRAARLVPEDLLLCWHLFPKSAADDTDGGKMASCGGVALFSGALGFGRKDGQALGRNS